MRSKLSAEVTGLLLDWRDGDQEALAQLMPLVCDELRALARSYLNKESADHTMQPTALVSEVYLRLHRRRTVNWQGRAHFFGSVAQMMRRILVDHARGKQRHKRGDGERPLPLDEAFGLAARQDLDLVALNDALTALEKLDPRQAAIVNLRFFVGLTVEETAAALDIGTATVKRDWKIAKRWLFRELERR